MEKYVKLKQIILDAEEDFSKFFEKDNKAAGTRARKAMQEVKNLAQEIRKDIQSMKNEG
ncbi:MAG: histone H1 [Bacteroidota bacterium]